MVLEVQNPPPNSGDLRDVGSIPESARSLEKGIINPLQYFFPGESPWTEESGGKQSMGHKESDKTEAENSLIVILSQQ